MITSAIIPKPLARLPWRLIFLVAGIAGFGMIVLYSAAGGSAQPWALKQSIVFLLFLGVAIAMSWLPESTIKMVAFPLYAVTLVMLISVEALGFVS
jgi:rod shape determining protein RodA